MGQTTYGRIGYLGTVLCPGASSSWIGPATDSSSLLDVSEDAWNTNGATSQLIAPPLMLYSALSQPYASRFSLMRAAFPLSARR
jgi:hypothetical protein